MIPHLFFSSFFFFNDTATTEIYTLSLHDALPIFQPGFSREAGFAAPRDYPLKHYLDLLSEVRALTIRHLGQDPQRKMASKDALDRKSTRLNSSHGYISYAVFCLKKKKNIHVLHGF